VDSSSSYVLRVPFSLQPDHAIGGLDSPIQFLVGGHPAILSSNHGHYALAVKGFTAEKDASEFLPMAWAGLVNLTAQGSACSASFELSPVTRSDDPVAAATNLSASFGGAVMPPEVHGLADGNRPTIARASETIKYLSGGSAKFTISAGPERTIALLQAGLRAVHSVSAFADGRVRTAFDIYVASAHEASRSARLLMRAMVLEVLSPPSPKHQIAQNLLDVWQEELASTRSAVPKGSEEAEALDSLERELLFRREMSIRSRILGFVRATLEASGNSDSAALAKRARSAYDVRSVLMHEGIAPDSSISTAIADLDRIIPMLFQAILGIS